MGKGTHEDMSALEDSTMQQEQICRVRQLLLGAQSQPYMPVGDFKLSLALACLLIQCAFIDRPCQMHFRGVPFGLASSVGIQFAT